MKAMTMLVAVCSCVALVACRDEPAQNRGATEAAGTQQDAECERGMVTTESGLEYEEIECGTGEEAARGDTVLVHYTGTLGNGEEFDPSRGGEPFAFTIGAGQVIQGWEEGIAGMRVGGRRRLTIPPVLGFGAAGYPPVIPKNATLIFDVELLAVK